MRLKLLIITLIGLLLLGWHLFLQCRSSGFTYRLLTLFIAPYWTTFVLLGAGVAGAVAARVGGRRGLGVAAVAVALGLIAIPAVATAQVAAFGYALVFALAIFALGAKITETFLPPPPANVHHENLLPPLIAYGLGSGAFSLLTLLGGVLGGAAYSTPALLILSLIFLPSARRLIRRTGWLRGGEKLSPTGGALWLTLVAGVALLGWFAFLPPLEYDVLEYHALLPLTYLRENGVAFQPQNMFSGFPQNSEMLTYALFNIAGVETGVIAAQWLNFLFLPLTLLALVALVRRVAGNLGATAAAATNAGLLAALTLLAQAGTMQWSAILYVENLTVFYVALTVLLTLRAVRENSRRAVVFAGIFAGLAAGVKYPGLIFAGAPAAALIFLFWRGGWREKISNAILAGGACWLTLAPWLAKNYLTAGNPFYPLWNLFFRVADWDATQETRSRLSHSPSWGLPPDVSPFSVDELLNQIAHLFLGLGNEASGALLLVGIPALYLWRHSVKNASGGWRETAIIALWLGAIFIGWFGFTHRIERFFYAGTWLTAVLSGIGLAALLTAAANSRQKIIAPSIAVMARILPVATGLTAGVVLTAWLGNYFPAEEKDVAAIDVLLGEVSPEKYRALNYRYEDLREFLHRESARDARVLALGAADVFYLPSNVDYAVVFNRQPFLTMLDRADSAEALARELRAAGYTHIYVHWHELLRLQQSYYRAFAPAPEKSGLLDQFWREQTRTVFSTPAPANERLPAATLFAIEGKREKSFKVD
ncbi:MAG: glycosyltransferase family 39 protein [Planctomycetota bacterium]|jgi:4-amino-4-deoxy-L-arabinose transferase-like glycosyltransferase|nr:glycosyltransferase family 39 protein [Planctomycetota bacterium]